MPVAMSIPWKPLRDSHYVVASLQHEGGGLRQLVARQSILHDVQAIARENPDWTIVGLLLGERFDCSVTLAPYVLIESHVEVALPSLDERSVVDAIQTLRGRIGRGNSTDVLGWFCSNGSADARVSPVHAAIHAASFAERWQTVLVIGNGANAGAFFLHDQSAARWFHAPFFELVDWDAGRRPPKPTCVAWPAYLTTAATVPLAEAPTAEPVAPRRPPTPEPARQRSATFARPIVTTRRTPTREAIIEAGRAAGRSVLDFAKSLGVRAISALRRVFDKVVRIRAERAEIAARQKAEAEAARAREEERRAKVAAERRVAREAAQRQAAELAKQRAAEMEARRAAEAEVRRKEMEARRAAEDEARRKEAEEAAKRRAAEAEARRKAAEEAEQRRAAEAEAKRQAAEAEAQRRAEAEARRQAEEAEARRVAELEAQRKAAEEAQRRAAEAEARRKAAEEAEARRKVEEEERRKAEEEKWRRAAEAEAEKQRRAAEAEVRRQAAEVEARRLAAEAEAEAKRQAAEEEARRRTEAEAEARRQAAEAEARRRAEEEARRIAAEAESRRQAEEAKAAARRQAEEAEAERLRQAAEVEAEQRRQAVESEAEARRKEAEAAAERRRKAEEAEALRISVEVAAIRQKLARAPVEGPKRQAPNGQSPPLADLEDTKATDGPYRYLALARREGFEVSEKIERGTLDRPETVWLLHDATSGLRLFVVASDEEVREATLHYNLRTGDDSVLQATAPEHRDLKARVIYGREACLNGLRAKCRRLRATGALERDWKVSPT